MNICELRQQYRNILDMPLMKYETMRTELEQLIRENESDSRRGIVSIVDQARKKIEEIEEEILRVRKMMDFDRQFGDYGAVCGIDEVGRGPLAGPVMTAAVILPRELVIPKLNDSKQVPRKQREELYDIIMSNAVAVGIGMNSEKVIDEKGIEYANKNAMQQAVSHLSVQPDLLIVDSVHIPDMPMRQESFDKGDAKSAAVAAASIVAKVTRDRMMQEYDAKYPGYGFGENMGYGSARHIEALEKMGPCPIHRRCYIRKIMERLGE